MPRPLWTGAISFGLVTIPVKVVSATQDHSIHFRQVHLEDLGRVRTKKVCELDGQALSQDEIGKGYELSKEQTVPITDEELDQMPLPTAKAIEIVAFLDADSIDPIRISDSYYLATDGQVAAKPYTLLRRALERSDKVAVAKFTWHNRERLGLLRVSEGAIVLHSMRWPDEIRSPESLAPRTVELDEDEIERAVQLTDTLALDSITGFRDTYRDALEELLTAKAEGKELPVVRKLAGGAGAGRGLDGRAERVGRGGEGESRRRRGRGGHGPRDAALEEGRPEEEGLGQEGHRPEEQRQEDNDCGEEDVGRAQAHGVEAERLLRGGPVVSLPRIAPMLATPGKLPPASVDDAYAYEVKQDGQRCIVYLPGDGTVVLRSRSGADITPAYPELAGLRAALGPRPAVLDGEVVALDGEGRSDFERLQSRMGLAGSPAKAARTAKEIPAHLMLFDIVFLDARHLTLTPYAERRTTLESLVLAGAAWSTPAAVIGHGQQALEMTRTASSKVSSPSASLPSTIRGQGPGRGSRSGTCGPRTSSSAAGCPGTAASRPCPAPSSWASPAPTDGSATSAASVRAGATPNAPPSPPSLTPWHPTPARSPYGPQWQGLGGWRPAWSERCATQPAPKPDACATPHGTACAPTSPLTTWAEFALRPQQPTPAAAGCGATARSARSPVRTPGRVPRPVRAARRAPPRGRRARRRCRRGRSHRGGAV